MRTFGGGVVLDPRFQGLEFFRVFGPEEYDMVIVFHAASGVSLYLSGTEIDRMMVKAPNASAMLNTLYELIRTKLEEHASRLPPSGQRQ